MMGTQLCSTWMYLTLLIVGLELDIVNSGKGNNNYVTPAGTLTADDDGSGEDFEDHGFSGDENSFGSGDSFTIVPDVKPGKSHTYYQPMMTATPSSVVEDGIIIDRKTDVQAGAAPPNNVDIEVREGDDDLADVDDVNRKAVPIMSQSLINHPGIIAAVIGGAVLVLLCLVLVAMFIVYRMRKKDEGSYSLGEDQKEKLTPSGKTQRSASIVYTKAHSNDDCFS